MVGLFIHDHQNHTPIQHVLIPSISPSQNIHRPHQSLLTSLSLSTGLGAYMARTLASNGASKVFIIGRRLPSLESVASSLPSHPNTIIPIVGDVTSKESLQTCLTQISSQTTHIDVLIANSGIGGPPVQTLDPSTQDPIPFDDLVNNMLAPTPEAVASTYLVNVVGVHFTIATFLPLLHAANERRPKTPTKDNFTARPQIITTGSIGGFNRKPYGNLSYGPSKAAVMHMTKQLATMLVPYDIRANSIAPG